MSYGRKASEDRPCTLCQLIKTLVDDQTELHRLAALWDIGTGNERISAWVPAVRGHSTTIH
jgi:hypothetical protein